MLRRRGSTVFGSAAFTLIEIVIALAVLGAMSSGCYLGFNAITNYAVSSRLYSEAITAAQNQIDLVLSRGPFDISAAYPTGPTGAFVPSLNKIPIELMTTTELDTLAASGVNFPTTAPAAPPAVTSAYYPYYPYFRTATGQPLKKQAFIYRDPVTGSVVVTGELTTHITDAALSMTYINATPTNLNTRRAAITVSYDFKSRLYDVKMDTLRTADQ